jgi:DNA-binding IclR family transcriptional regulator
VLADLQKKTRLNKTQVQRITAFLKEYEFVTVNDAKEEIRLEEAVRKFLTQNITS